MRVSLSLMKQLFVYWCLYILEPARYVPLFLVLDTRFLNSSADLFMESCRIHSHFMPSVGHCGIIQKDSFHSWNMQWLCQMIHLLSHIVPGRWYLIVYIVNFHFLINMHTHITFLAFFRLFQTWETITRATRLGTALTFLRCYVSLPNLAMQSQCEQCLIILWSIVLKCYFLVLAISMYVFSP